MTRRTGQTGQLDFQGRSHDHQDCGSYTLVRRVGPSQWEVRWTAPCDTGMSVLRFVSRKQYDRYF